MILYLINDPEYYPYSSRKRVWVLNNTNWATHNTMRVANGTSTKFLSPELFGCIFWALNCNYSN